MVFAFILFLICSVYLPADNGLHGTRVIFILFVWIILYIYACKVYLLDCYKKTGVVRELIGVREDDIGVVCMGTKGRTRDGNCMRL